MLSVLYRLRLLSNPSTLKPTKQLYKLHNCNMQLLHGIHGLRRQVKIVEASIPFVFKTIQGLQYCVICYRASIIVKFVPHKSVERQLMRNREATALIDFWINSGKLRDYTSNLICITEKVHLLKEKADSNIPASVQKFNTL